MTVCFTVENFEAADGSLLRYGKLSSAENNTECQPIVFIPGLGGSVKQALGFLEQFVPDLGSVFSLDARGLGLNEDVRPQLLPWRYLRDFQAFVHHLQVQNVFREGTFPVLFGLSLGSVYAVKYLALQQHPFQATVLFAPAFCPNPTLFTRLFRLRNYLRILMRGVYANTVMPYGIRDLTRNPTFYTDPMFQDPLVMPTYYLFLVDWMCRRAACLGKRLTVPTAVVVPEQDSICSTSDMKAFYDRLSITDKKLLTYPNLYHDIFLEPDPDRQQVVNDIRQWMMLHLKTQCIITSIR